MNLKAKELQPKVKRRKTRKVALLILFFFLAVISLILIEFAYLRVDKPNDSNQITSVPNNTNVETEKNTANNNFDFKGEASEGQNENSNLDVTDPYNYYDLGNLALSKQEYQKAIDYYNKAIELNAIEPNFYNKKAEAQVGMEQKELAIRTLEQGLLNCPNDNNLKNKLDIIKNVVK